MEFAIREGGKTVGAGMYHQLLNNIQIYKILICYNKENYG